MSVLEERVKKFSSSGFLDKLCTILNISIEDLGQEKKDLCIKHIEEVKEQWSVEFAKKIIISISESLEEVSVEEIYKDETHAE